jgi:hypothetical protein
LLFGQFEIAMVTKIRYLLKKKENLVKLTSTFALPRKCVRFTTYLHKYCVLKVFIAQGKQIVENSKQGREHFFDKFPIIRGHVRSILSYPILSYPILSYPILSYPILSYPILSYPILSYPILFGSSGVES